MIMMINKNDYGNITPFVYASESQILKTIEYGYVGHYSTNKSLIQICCICT